MDFLATAHNSRRRLTEGPGWRLRRPRSMRPKWTAASNAKFLRLLRWKTLLETMNQEVHGMSPRWRRACNEPMQSGPTTTPVLISWSPRRDIISQVCGRGDFRTSRRYPRFADAPHGSDIPRWWERGRRHRRQSTRRHWRKPSLRRLWRFGRRRSTWSGGGFKSKPSPRWWTTCRRLGSTMRKRRPKEVPKDRSRLRGRHQWRSRSTT